MFDVLLVIVVGTSLWVLLDALRIGVRKGQISGFFNMGAFGWFFSCLLIWILAFPAYLAKRQLYIDAAAELETPQESKFIPDQIERFGRTSREWTPDG